MSGLFSFGAQQCLRFKLIAAYKAQQGWPNFTAPYADRYLTATVVQIIDTTALHYPDGTPLPGDVKTQTNTFTTDRTTGQITFPTDYGALGLVIPGFPYGGDLTNDPAVQWIVGDTSYTRIQRYNEPPLLGEVVSSVQVTLSDPYSLAMLESDLDGLIAAVDINSVAWFSLYATRVNDEITSAGPYGPEFRLTELLPTYVNYDDIGGAPGAQLGLESAAWNIWAPGFVSQIAYLPNGATKMIGYVALPGNYCKQSFIIDFQQKLLNEVCESGVGSCQNPFLVKPPPLAAGTNSYVLIEPNCQCG